MKNNEIHFNCETHDIKPCFDHLMSQCLSLLPLSLFLFLSLSLTHSLTHSYKIIDYFYYKNYSKFYIYVCSIVHYRILDYSSVSCLCLYLDFPTTKLYKLYNHIKWRHEYLLNEMQAFILFSRSDSLKIGYDFRLSIRRIKFYLNVVLLTSF